MEEKKVELKIGDENLGGHYANLAVVSHNEEEFFLDFFLAHFPVGKHQARIVLSPGHMKRISIAIQEELRKYEAAFNKKIEAASEPNAIGFQSPSPNKK